jgi:hypothetical protein
MSRFAVKLLAGIGLLAAAVPVIACRGEMPPPRPVLAATQSDAVIVGTVLDIDEQPTSAKPHPDAVEEMTYSVATVRIDRPLNGVKNLTHVRVAVPFGSLDRAGAPFHEGGKFLFFLQKHSVTQLLLLSNYHQPVDLSKPGSGDVLHRVTMATTAMNDPVKALTAKESEDRVIAAIALAQWYRRVPPNSNGTDRLPRPAEEGKLLLTALAEGEWNAERRYDETNPYGVILGMGLENDGFKLPGNTNGEEVGAATKKAFVKWLADSGDKAVVRQIVAKK